MSETDLAKNLTAKELDQTQVEAVGGGLDFCDGDQIKALTKALKESYDNLVDFTSYVIERIAGGSGNP
jgi:hypothetical protein